jgi:hypothetical protein
MGNLSLRAQDRVVRAALALQRLYTLIGGGDNDGTWTWARPDWLDAFPEMTPENLAKANAAQKAADERRRQEADRTKLHATPGQRRGQLKNGNPAGDYLASSRCGAHTRVGGCCRQPAMANGRCRMHGGLSTGPRTAEGQARARAARFVHGFRTAEIIDFRAAAARSARRLAMLTKVAREATAPAGHGVHRSDSSASLGEKVTREDTKLVLGPRAAWTRGAQRKQIHVDGTVKHNASGLARKLASSVSSVALWFKSRPRRAPGHAVHRSDSPTRGENRTGTRRLAA